VTEELFDDADRQAFLASLAWRAHARCKGVSTSVFFPARGDGFSLRVARQLCQCCPVQAECRAYALSTHVRYGVWGGTSERQRVRLRRGR
jgi:WhiB family redox-sensing transcriptional regulator